MPVVIRLARFGSTHDPKYRVTVADSRRWRNGRFIEVVGHYNPSPRGKEKGLHLEVSKIQDWIQKGAQPTERVRHLLKEYTKTAANA